MKTIGIGLVGTGFARTTQAPVFRLIEGARLVAVTSGRIESAKRMAGEFAMRAVGSWDELVTLPEVELVVITSPPNTHRPSTLAALAAGEHVICEKPMAMTADEALEMTSAAQARPDQLAIIDHELRFNPTYQRMKQLVDEGYLGKLYHISMTVAAGFRHSALRPWNWWSQKDAGGGLLGALGSHAIDTLRWLFGDIDAVASSVATIVPMRVDPDTNSPRQVETDDYCSFLFRFRDSQALGTVTLTAVQASGGTNELTLAGERGTIILDNEKLLASQGFNSPFEDLTPSDPARGSDGVPDNQWARSFYHLAGKTIGALQNGESKVENAATFNDGLKCQRMIDAIIRASVSQQWEKVV